MRKSQDIEILRLVSEVQALQSKANFYMEKAENAVSREEYDAKEAENAALGREMEALRQAHAEEIAALKESHRAEIAGIERRYQADLAGKDRQLKEFEEINTLLKTENTDFKTLWQFWQGHHFGASSETMTDMMDNIVGKLPENKVGLLADILSMVDILNRTEGNPYSVRLAMPASRQSKVPKGPQARAVSRESSAKNHKKPKCFDVRGILGPCFDDMPPGFKVMKRDGKDDTDYAAMLPNRIVLPKDGGNASAA